MKAIVEHFKEYESFYCLIILLLFFCALLIFCFLCIYDFCVSIETKEELFLKTEEYEKILEREFGQSFDSYNEYLVYKIENGGVD